MVFINDFTNSNFIQCMFKNEEKGNTQKKGVNVKDFSKWKEEEVKSLFECMEKTKKNNKSLLDGFREFAKKSKRKTNSIRNYYYLEVENLKNNRERVKKLGINLSAHNIQNPAKFSPDETEKLVTEILRLKCLGFSVRKACLKLANNSAEEMLRFQNKFRSIIKKDRPLYNKCLMNLKKAGLSEQNKSKSIEKSENVIYMKKPEEKKLTEQDVNSLFLGLVRLVKKNAIESIEKDLVSEAEFANSTLRETLIKVSNLQKEIEIKGCELNKEKEKNKLIAEENFKLKTKVADLIGSKINHRNKSLSKYLQDIKNKGIEIKTKI